jgi:hypothetical protein
VDADNVRMRQHVYFRVCIGFTVFRAQVEQGGACFPAPSERQTGSKTRGERHLWAEVPEADAARDMRRDISAAVDMSSANRCLRAAAGVGRRCSSLDRVAVDPRAIEFSRATDGDTAEAINHAPRACR